jgi:Kef-type K+ transport system membrane component KefB
MTSFELSARFFIEVAVILAACRLFGVLARRAGQPQVIAEMLAGVVLGPSVLGLLLPDVQARLFPRETLPALSITSQLGLSLYMFLVGLEFQGALLRTQLKRAASVSVTGILVPFALGAILATVLVREGGYFTAGVDVGQAVLFLGAAMSITAFPVLARIIDEQRLTGTRLGTLVLAAGAMDDAAAWCLLAVVIATMGGSMTTAWITIIGCATYALVVLTAGRSVLAPLGRTAEREGRLGDAQFTAVLILVMMAAAATDAIGVHAVFGTFILGAAMPRGIVAQEMQRRIAPLTMGLLVPLFFAYSGLNTQIGLLNSAALWAVAAVVLLIACVSKAAACALAARVNGEDWRDALAIGTLMNARGMMELIILAIGLERGIITPTLFTMMVMMAIVTTVAATPAFVRVYRSAEHASGLPFVIRDS